ncbi:uncharacterized protein LOC119077915 isoform X2 [Bradysia coprophila]|uniref:uncharacterized protein LOC119077915 isoform X2 n=1 Tax=Bradysia coprophila TaxID=38358 RepID=UPI00187DDA81|nr:uncharacterized protein LOC119077915 isoform X2 [Bradysia coprophila]
MASKKCIYRGCTNKGTSEPTLFAFPKDEARRNLWLDLAGRSGHTLQKSDSLCELHFGRQYISSNQRRKVLVGLSVPHPYQQDQEQDNDDEQQIEALDECERLDIEDMFCDDNQQPEDSFSPSSAIEHVEHGDYEPEMKRKMIRHSPQNGTISQPIKLMKIELSQPKPKNGIETAQRPHIKDTAKLKSAATSIIDHPDVSTLYIRGEEFIQMPTSLYLEEKSKLETSHIDYAQEIVELREELDRYKDAIKIIRDQVRSLP